MNDEDFVMGYCVGYNDGAQSGGGGDVPTGDTVIYNDVTIAKRWNLTGTPFSVALFDVHSDRLICGTKSETQINSLEQFDAHWIYYWLSMGLIYNGDIVTVNPLYAVSDCTVLNGTPYLPYTAYSVKSIGGNAAINHTSTTSSNGDVTHKFSLSINPTMLIHDIEYYRNQIKSESDRNVSNGSSTVLSWKLTISADGTKQMLDYDPYWFFYPTAISSSSAGYIKKGILGVPNGTSTQQLFQTGKLVETLKESLINAGENVTLEEV